MKFDLLNEYGSAYAPFGKHAGEFPGENFEPEKEEQPVAPAYGSVFLNISVWVFGLIAIAPFALLIGR